jgi:hypothetical protein
MCGDCVITVKEASVFLPALLAAAVPFLKRIVHVFLGNAPYPR